MTDLAPRAADGSFNIAALTVGHSFVTPACVDNTQALPVNRSLAVAIDQATFGPQRVPTGKTFSTIADPGGFRVTRMA